MHEEVVIRHAASNQLQRNAPHCKPPAAPKRPPDRRQTAPAPACAYPTVCSCHTDEASPFALRSTRKSSEESNAPRRALDGRATPSGCLVAAVVTVALAVLPSPKPALVCQAANAGPQQGARRVPAGRLRGRGDPGCPSAFRAVVRLLSASLLVRHGVPGGGDGVRPDTTGQAVSGRLSDRGVHCGRRTRPRGHWTGTGLADVSASSRGAGGHDGRVSVLGAAEVSRREQAHCRPVRSWPGRAGSVVGRGRLARRMVGRWAVEVSAAWPSPSGPGPVPIGWAVTLNWGCPADRTVERSAMSVARPATAGCPH
jgi:hypothetical protein